MLVNRDRAAQIMERENLDALVAVLPINSYYLSNYWGIFNTARGYDAAYIAVLPKDTDRPAGLIVPAVELYRVVTKGTWIENLYPYSSPQSDAVLEGGLPKGNDYSGWQKRPGADLTDLERGWVDIVATLGTQMSPNAFWAVTRALKAAGLDEGRIGSDDPRLQGWLEACGLTNIKCDYRVDLFNEIRLIKTPDELKLMRKAALINEKALLTAAYNTQEGMSWRDVENIYMHCMLDQGGRGIYLTCGVGDLPGGKVRRNEPIFFDGLGQYEHYHGDFGRCVIVGEMLPEQIKRHTAMCKGWDAAQELLKPGTTYSALSEAIGHVIRKEGIEDFRNPVVHSLGLEHTDDPKFPGVSPQDKPDQTLMAGMVINIDFLYTEIGWGSLHMDDTILITQDGSERFSTADFSIRIAF